MKAFIKLVELQIQTSLYYSKAFVIGLGTNLTLLLAQLFLWRAIYAASGQSTIRTFDERTMYTYTVLAFFVNRLLSWRTENLLSRKIISGSIVKDCILPVPFLSIGVADMTGGVVLEGSIMAVFTLLVFFLFPGGLEIAPLYRFAPFLISLGLAVVLRLLIVHTLSLLCFFTTSHLGLTWARDTVADFFSGAFLPLAFFPGMLKTAAYLLPFHLYLQTPIAIYLGLPTHHPMPVTFVLQLVWCGIFLILQDVLWKHIRRDITIAGG